MTEINTEILIYASLESVWSVLTDFATYPQWNPFIRSVKGQPQIGENLQIVVQPPSRKAMIFTPKILRAIPNQELRWRGRLLLPGIFDGEHYFIVEKAEETGGTRFIHGECFSGILLPVILGANLRESTKAGFEEMNKALKARAEAVLTR